MGIKITRLIRRMDSPMFCIVFMFDITGESDCVESYCCYCWERRGPRRWRREKKPKTNKPWIPFHKYYPGSPTNGFWEERSAHVSAVTGSSGEAPAEILKFKAGAELQGLHVQRSAAQPEQ